MEKNLKESGREWKGGNYIGTEKYKGSRKTINWFNILPKIIR